jgi:DNA repair protein SbcC/Rad50
LEFQIENGDTFRPITGNTIAQTQEKITGVLHMDYDTFVNSAFLRQGHADEFTRQAAAKRKEVLANILGLGIYDTLEERAKEQAHLHEANNAQFENTITEINNDLAHKPEYAAELEKAEAALKDIDLKAKEQEAILTALRQKKERLEHIKSQLNELQENIAAKTADLKRWQEQSVLHLSNIKKYEAVMARLTEIEAGYANYAAAKKTADEFEQKAMQSRTLDKRREQLERKIDQSRNELIRQHAVKKTTLQELEKKTATLPDLKSQLQKQQASAQSLAGADKLINDLEQRIRETQAEASRLEAENARLEKEISEAAEKLDLIERHTAAHTEAKCPLCEQDLTREALELIHNKYIKEREDKHEQLLSNRVALTQKQANCTAAQKEKAALESKTGQEKTRVRGQEEFIRNKIKEIEENAAGLAELKGEAGEIEAALAGNRFALAEQPVLREITGELSALGYDPAKHETARNQLKQLEAFEAAKRQLDEAVRLIEQEKTATARANEAVQGLQENLVKDVTRKEALNAELTGLPQAAQELAFADAEYKTITGQRAQAQQAVGSVTAKLQRLAEQENKKKEYEDRIAQSAREESIYKELARAFGKNGIQALIIDAALPEIADEANRLLARLTDNRMTVKFETQRSTKKDTLKETLDIIIADELGTRNYEMFSGGEAFRINFAIRIALSRLLARRAGAPLPTIIIDEGFGTQDATGMEKLKEAINSIQNDFEKILVITHMDDLKDAFPARIDVVKTSDGSTITIN